MQTHAVGCHCFLLFAHRFGLVLSAWIMQKQRTPSKLVLWASAMNNRLWQGSSGQPRAGMQGLYISAKAGKETITTL